ncbi:trans-sulfuration enzyme family protein [Peijinzhouia sedimentorum]
MNKKHFETDAIRGQMDRTIYQEHSAPIFPTSSFVFETAEMARDMFNGDIEGNIYSRYSNPNTNEFIQKLCLLEGTEAGVATASGMSAMFLSIASFLESGDHVLASRSLFGSTHQILTQLLPRWGITSTYVDIDKPETWEAAIQPNTKMFFAETPSNPGLDLLDLEFMGELCKRKGILMNIDNCFATPYLQNPQKFGADIITHSATKFIDGQGRVLGGAVLASKELIEKVTFLSRHTGPALSPFNAWILSKSLETLHVRMDRHCKNALKIAEWLQNHPNVKWVKYPFLVTHPNYEIARKQMKMGGGLVTFELKTGEAGLFEKINKLEMIKISANLGDTRTIITHPASTTHSKLSQEDRGRVNITNGLLRLSVGLENAEDIISDLERVVG